MSRVTTNVNVTVTNIVSIFNFQYSPTVLPKCYDFLEIMFWTYLLETRLVKRTKSILLLK